MWKILEAIHLTVYIIYRMSYLAMVGIMVCFVFPLFSFCENISIRKHFKYEYIFLKHMNKVPVEIAVDFRVKDVLPKTFSILFDRWSRGDSH